MVKLAHFSTLCASTALFLGSGCSLLERPAANDDDEDGECDVDTDCRPEAFCHEGDCIGRPGIGGTGGGGTAGGGGDPMTGGTVATAGANNVGGAGGTTAVTGGGPAAGGSPMTPTVGVCPSSISTGVTTCTNPCTGSICGLGDLGRRDCACSGGVYRCSSCQFSGGQPVTQQPAGALPACSTAVSDDVSCTVENDRCMAGEEVCACLRESSSFRWDCDDPPWGRPPCPPSLPASGASCGVTRYACVYVNTLCSCEASGLWSCTAS